MSALPPHLRASIQQLLQGQSRRDLAQNADATSIGYRNGRGSAGLIRHTSDVAAYLTARMPATFAAVAAAMREIRSAMPAFTPHRLLDVACGPGTASFAAAEAWPLIETASMVDANTALLAAARTLTGASDVPALQKAEIVHARVGRTTPQLPEADLVTIAYALVEMPAADVAGIVKRLWEACRGVLLLVEPGSREGFERIRRCRDMLADVGANVVAPCTHDAPCPMAAPDWCHFAQRLPRSRDHMIAKAASVPYEDEKFAYVALARQKAGVRASGRVLAPPKLTKGQWRAPVCASGAIALLDVQRGDARYRGLKKVGWGNALGRELVECDGLLERDGHG